MMDALDKHFHAVAAAIGQGKDARLGVAPMEDEDGGDYGPLHGIDCRYFGIEDGCPVCDPEGYADYKAATR
jgi:hypothetical protein